MHVTSFALGSNNSALSKLLQFDAYFYDYMVVCCSLHGVGLGLGRWYGPTDNSGWSVCARLTVRRGSMTVNVVCALTIWPTAASTWPAVSWPIDTVCSLVPAICCFPTTSSTTLRLRTTTIPSRSSSVSVSSQQLTLPASKLLVTSLTVCK